MALDICTEIQGFLHNRHPEMPLGEMNLGGSLLDDLQVHVQIYYLGVFVNNTVYHNLIRYMAGSHMNPNGGFCMFVYSGGQCRPCMSAGSFTTGVFALASCTWRGNVDHTPSALDGPKDQSGVFS